eukprot:2085741-Prorocentrum_lima.AAC.1
MAVGVGWVEHVVEEILLVVDDQVSRSPWTLRYRSIVVLPSSGLLPTLRGVVWLICTMMS